MKSSGSAKVWAGEAAAAGAEAAPPPQQTRENRGQAGSQGLPLRQTSPSGGCKRAAMNFCRLPASLPKEKSVALQLSACRFQERFRPHHLVLCQPKWASSTALGRVMKWPQQLQGGAARSDLPSHLLQFPGVLLELGKSTTSATEKPTK